MKKFELVYFSDVRWCSEVNKIVEIECLGGCDEVVDFICKNEIDENENWIEEVGDFLNDKNWKENENWIDDLVYGDKDGLFIVSLCDEVNEVLVISEDSEYFGKFKRNVEVDDVENVKLYYRIWENII